MSYFLRRRELLVFSAILLWICLPARAGETASNQAFEGFLVPGATEVPFLQTYDAPNSKSSPVKLAPASLESTVCEKANPCLKSYEIRRPSVGGVGPWYRVATHFGDFRWIQKPDTFEYLAYTDYLKEKPLTYDGVIPHLRKNPGSDSPPAWLKPLLGTAKPVGMAIVRKSAAVKEYAIFDSPGGRSLGSEVPPGFGPALSNLGAWFYSLKKCEISSCTLPYFEKREGYLKFYAQENPNFSSMYAQKVIATLARSPIRFMWAKEKDFAELRAFDETEKKVVEEKFGYLSSFHPQSALLRSTRTVNKVLWLEVEFGLGRGWLPAFDSKGAPTVRPVDEVSAEVDAPEGD